MTAGARTQPTVKPATLPACSSRYQPSSDGKLLKIAYYVTFMLCCPCQMLLGWWNQGGLGVLRESRDSYRILVGKPEGDGYSLGDPMHGGRMMSKCIILINNQLDALFSMYLFPLSTCFEQPSAHHQENRIVSIHHLVCITLCRWLPGMLAYQTVTYTEWYIPDDVLIQFDSPDDEHWVARNM